MINAGAKVIPKYGELQIDASTGLQASALNAEGGFELEGLPPGMHPARILSDKGMCSFELQIPQSDELIVDLGEITCELR